MIAVTTMNMAMRVRRALVMILRARSCRLTECHSCSSVISESDRTDSRYTSDTRGDHSVAMYWTCIGPLYRGGDQSDHRMARSILLGVASANLLCRPWPDPHPSGPAADRRRAREHRC